MGNARTIAKGVSPHPSFREGAQNNAVLDAVEKASASKKWEPVEQLLK